MSTALKRMTVDEFLPWAEGREGRWELHDGVPVMMSPERSLHAETKLEALVGLARDPFERLDCHVASHPDGMVVRVDARTTYEPDAFVVCGPRAPPDALEIDNPVIVVEVLSPSTAAVDHGRKSSARYLSKALPPRGGAAGERLDGITSSPPLLL